MHSVCPYSLLIRGGIYGPSSVAYALKMIRTVWTLFGLRPRRLLRTIMSTASEHVMFGKQMSPTLSRQRRVRVVDGKYHSQTPRLSKWVHVSIADFHWYGPPRTDISWLSIFVQSSRIFRNERIHNMSLTFHILRSIVTRSVYKQIQKYILTASKIGKQLLVAACIDDLVIMTENKTV